MGVQCVKPAPRMPAMTGSGRSKVAKLRPVRGAAGSAAGAVESGITSPSHAGGGGRKSSRRGLDPRAWGMGQNPRMSARPEAARIMLGFVVRQCAVALGHAPTPEELACWANEQRDARGRYRIFGREISTDEARVILRHPGRLVTVRPSPRWAFGLVVNR